MAGTMGRALTKRQKRPEVSAPMPVQREGTARFAAGTIKRSKISGPVDLVSSTNLIAYTSPDIQQSQSKSLSHSRSLAHFHSSTSGKPKPPSASSSSSSLRSGGEDSDIPQCSTPVTSPDIPSQDSSPVSTEPKKQDQFQNSHHSYSSSSQHTQHSRSDTNNSSVHTRSSTSTSTSSAAKAASTTPPLPQRSLSHTKSSHQELARQRSVSRTNQPPTSVSTTHASRVNQDQRHSPQHVQEQQQQHKDRHHPFGKELEQVNEVAEEFGAHLPETKEEERALLAKGFRKFSVEDYLFEIQDLYQTIFCDELKPAGPGAGRSHGPVQAWI